MIPWSCSITTEHERWVTGHDSPRRATILQPAVLQYLVCERKEMELRWKASFSASCLHAAACLSEGMSVIDTTIAALLQPATEEMLRELNACGLASGTTLPLLVGLAAECENNRQLIELAVRRTVGAGAVGELAVSRLAGCIADLEAAWLRQQPTLVDELAVRGRPLREQWEARGPGLLGSMRKLTVENFIAPAAEVVLVSPFVGGYGRAHLLSNRVTLEAVLTNPNPELPETLRMGWLLAQLNLDLPMLSEPIARTHLSRLASLATLPLVLAAADVVELARCDEATLTRAITCWYLAPPLPDETPQILLDWWDAYTASDTRWPVAMAALDQMLSE